MKEFSSKWTKLLEEKKKGGRLILRSRENSILINQSNPLQAISMNRHMSRRPIWEERKNWWSRKGGKRHRENIRKRSIWNIHPHHHRYHQLQEKLFQRKILVRLRKTREWLHERQFCVINRFIFQLFLIRWTKTTSNSCHPQLQTSLWRMKSHSRTSNRWKYFVSLRLLPPPPTPRMSGVSTGVCRYDV